MQISKNSLTILLYILIKAIDSSKSNGMTLDFLSYLSIFAAEQNQITMSKPDTDFQFSKGQASLFFIVSLFATIFLLVFASSWFWVPLPFVLTFAVVALDKI